MGFAKTFGMSSSFAVKRNYSHSPVSLPLKKSKSFYGHDSTGSWLV